MLIFRVIDAADNLSYPVLIDKSKKVASVFFVQHLGYVMAGYACFLER